MQVILTVEVSQEGARQTRDCTWQILDGCPPLTGFRRIHCH